jgi:hypothetical protein
MNDIFWEWLDNFVVVYIDDILVYNNSMEEHVEHLQKVFQRLKERCSKLYAKFEKWKFWVTELDFWCAPNSLKDSNLSPKLKTTKKEGIGAHSLAHNTIEG